MSRVGLFDKVLGTGSDKMNEADGFAGVALCAIASDGVITEEEAASLTTSLTRMQTFKALSPKQINGIFEKLIRIIRAEGADKCLERSAAAVKPELHATAFAVATDLLLADGHVDAKEKQFLERLQRALGVDDATAVKIVEVIRIKNQG